MREKIGFPFRLTLEKFRSGPQPVGPSYFFELDLDGVALSAPASVVGSLQRRLDICQEPLITHVAQAPRHSPSRNATFIEKCHHLVELLLGERVVFMVVALRANRCSIPEKTVPIVLVRSICAFQLFFCRVGCRLQFVTSKLRIIKPVANVLIRRCIR